MNIIKTIPLTTFLLFGTIYSDINEMRIRFHFNGEIPPPQLITNCYQNLQDKDKNAFGIFLLELPSDYLEMAQNLYDETKKNQTLEAEFSFEMLRASPKNKDAFYADGRTITLKALRKNNKDPKARITLGKLTAANILRMTHRQYTSGLFESESNRKL